MPENEGYQDIHLYVFLNEIKTRDELLLLMTNAISDIYDKIKHGVKLKRIGFIPDTFSGCAIRVYYD